jgi:hypothetical protein
MSCIVHNLDSKSYFYDSQDNYFFELLYEMWRERFPESTKTLEDIKDVVTDGGRMVAPLAMLSVPTQEKEAEEEEDQKEASSCVKQEELDEIKDNLDEDQTAAIVDETQDKVVTAEEKATEPTVVTDAGGDDSLKDEVRFYMEYKCVLF